MSLILKDLFYVGTVDGCICLEAHVWGWITKCQLPSPSWMNNEIVRE